MAVVFRWGESKDMDRLLEAMNYAFRPEEHTGDFEKDIAPDSYFPRVMSKLYLHKDTAKYHFLTEEDGVIAGLVLLHPIPMHVAGETLRFSGVGTVSTRPGYRRKGYMVHMLETVIAEAKKRGDDLMVLGGQRQRYRHFGFDNAGAGPRFFIDKGNIRRTYDKVPEGYSFREVKEDDTELLAGLQKLRKAALTHSDLWDGIEYEALCTLEHWPYAVLKDGQLAGSFLLGLPSDDSMGLPSLEDLRLFDGTKAADVIAAYITSMDVPGVCVSNMAPEALDMQCALSKLSDFTVLMTGEMIRILNYRRTLSVYLKYRALIRPLADGEACFSFDDGERLKITVKDGVPEVTEAAAEDPCISFTADEAVRVLFSNEGHFTDEGKGLNAAAASWFPLPFYFTKSDEV
ncbi:MAG: GNAT family N-acetyltransferase [Lachnospiraceae bacterium]|nr:GNAT family N-acetyltransferase [Lachnospiraceae bacterium]